MLRLHFINVGDGDAILAELCEETGNSVSPERGSVGPGPGLGLKPIFRVLIDTGRPDPGYMPGSMRCTASDYLTRHGISYVDVLVITHLHIDHFAGLELMLPAGIRFGTVYSGYFPEQPAGLVQALKPEPGDERTLEGLVDCLKRWSLCVEKLGAMGTKLRRVDISIKNIRLGGGLTMDLIASDANDAYMEFGPDGESAAGHGFCNNEGIRLEPYYYSPEENGPGVMYRIWDDMIEGKTVPHDVRHWASKLRNPASLRVRLSYAGRHIGLAGDCYGACWDNEGVKPCDIFKVPHHGDRKSMTRTLAKRLNARYVVISCGGEYIPEKERPSLRMIELLRTCGAEVYFTDCFAVPGEEARVWDAAVFEIYEDGTITAP